MTDTKDLYRLIEELESWAGGIRQMPELAADYQRLTQAATTLRSMGEEIATVGDKRSALFREIQSLKQTLTQSREQLGEEEYLCHELGVSLEEERAETSKLREQLEEARAWAENFAVTAADNGVSRDKYKAVLVELRAEAERNLKADPEDETLFIRSGWVKEFVDQALTPQEVCEECGGVG